MREKSKIIILSTILVLVGLGIYFLESNQTKFNFNKSELKIDGEKITENISFSPDKSYHTLYRNFLNPIVTKNYVIKNSIEIINVECSSGTPYFNTQKDCFSSEDVCLSYTELNEYGCNAGYNYGFFKNNEYSIKVDYLLHPENIFKIQGKYYIKFIAYSENNHVNLKIGKNLLITGEGIVTAKRYTKDEEVIIYIPYSKQVEDFNIIEQTNFEFENKSLLHLIILLFSIFPGIIFFITWLIFGRENIEEDIPERLSMYPKERKPWLVSLVFNSPFSSLSMNLIPAIITDFYERKLISTKMIDKKIYIKINNSLLKNLDEIENSFLDILKFLEKVMEKEKDYFLMDMNKLQWKFKERNELNNLFKKFTKELNLEKGKYFQNFFKPLIFMSPLLALNGLFSLLFGSMFILGFNFFLMFFSLIIPSVTTLFSKYREDYYSEYQKWQSFKRFLASSDSMKIYGHKGVIIWGKFLVYATALGVADKVLKEMRDQKLISEQEYQKQIIISSPTYFASHTGFSSGGASSGGFSSAGGGGIGGGGGGGR